MPFLSKEESELPNVIRRKLALRRVVEHQEQDLEFMKAYLQEKIPSSEFVNAWGKASHPDPRAREYGPLEQEVRRLSST